MISANVLKVSYFQKILDV